MVRLEGLSEGHRKFLGDLQCPTFDIQPWVKGPSLSKRRVAIVSTAGLHSRDDRPFTRDAGDIYRVIPSTISASDLVMSHASPNFDRSGFQQDWNVVFPIDLLKDFAEDRTIGSIADFHYSFMGADDPTRWEQQASFVASLLKKDKVDAVLLVPV
ncbi:glycine/sarcosine/betaine reductase selenoprotein B family protein [Chloroflexota bacterium]